MGRSVHSLVILSIGVYPPLFFGLMKLVLYFLHSADHSDHLIIPVEMANDEDDDEDDDDDNEVEPPPERGGCE